MIVRTEFVKIYYSLNLEMGTCTLRKTEYPTEKRVDQELPEPEGVSEGVQTHRDPPSSPLRIDYNPQLYMVVSEHDNSTRQPN
jgi:hypothetical protein